MNLFGKFLEGSCEESKDGTQLKFSFPKSPLYLKVDITADGPEGPVCAEISGAESFDLLDSPNMRFVKVNQPTVGKL